MAGRPRIYQSVEDLEQAIEDYFNPEVVTTIDTHCGTQETGRQREPRTKVSVTGLAIALGFADKTTLYEYRDRDEFSYSVKRALTRIEQYHEERLSENSVAGAIFALKNMGWKDKTEQDIRYPDGVNLSFEKVPSFMYNLETKTANTITNANGTKMLRTKAGDVPM